MGRLTPSQSQASDLVVSVFQTTAFETKSHPKAKAEKIRLQRTLDASKDIRLQIPRDLTVFIEA